MNALPNKIDRLKFYVKLFEALKDIHSRGLIHNDIKPANIMLDQEEYEGIPFIIDFGLS